MLPSFNEKNLPESCNGCAAKGRVCSTFNNDGSCPCVNCLIKMMCNNQCEKYDEWPKEF